ncbi:cyclophilin-like fold protein [Planobispora takensis]|uniref:Cyclophilin-like domain-containing protein n=1 Tax=Planobispora takensis TaxID=1367882 RepID=A0A8J3T6J3_9ACTN|nr:cyclophilin-like fold protein [Planobispora takensis]GII05311.1 hypothetical protein Pta02_73190 [Planobispora takensis]
MFARTGGRACRGDNLDPLSRSAAPSGRQPARPHSRRPGGREKIGYLPRKPDTEGSPGSDPEDGDLIYNAAGIGHSDQVVHLGDYQATLERLTELQGGDVTVTLAR